MAPSKIEPRVHKRVLSDQQRRRDLALQRQQECRRNLQLHARRLAAGLSSGGEENEGGDEDVVEAEEVVESYDLEGGGGGGGESSSTKEDLKDLGLRQATRLKGAKAREWFSKQLMLPEWMIDIPPRLKTDWYVMSRPAGVRCVVVSSNGTTVSRQRNGRILHHFLCTTEWRKNKRRFLCFKCFCILDCIFHEPDKTYYVLDLMCWRGYSLYDCNTEFRFFWMNSKLAETDALKPASQYHRYRFSVLPVYECDVGGLQAAYSAPVPFTRDGIIFLNRYAHYVLGSTPLSLLWKDFICSEYPVDTDCKGNVPQHQQVVLVLGDDGSVATSDDPPVVLGTMPRQFLEQHDQHLKPGTCLRFNVGEQGLRIVDGKPVVADIHFQGVAGRNKIADTSNKILYQYAARRDPLTISNLVAAVESIDDEGDFSMTGRNAES